MKLSAFADDMLHISKTEQVRFETLVNTNPTTGPLGLIVGVPGINGPGESIADISESDVFLNAGRVGKEQLKVEANSHSGGDSLIAAFGYRTCFFSRPECWANIPNAASSVPGVWANLM